MSQQGAKDFFSKLVATDIQPNMLSMAVATLATTQLTVYHVNPLHEGVMPLVSLLTSQRTPFLPSPTTPPFLFQDMDTADIAGDAFFDLRSKVLPIECAANTSRSSFAGDCKNQEVVDSDLVITKLSLSVKDEKAFGQYSRCNICDAGGHDPLSGLPCKPSKYICTCGSCAWWCIRTHLRQNATCGKTQLAAKRTCGKTPN